MGIATEKSKDGAECVCVRGYRLDPSGTCTQVESESIADYIHVILGAMAALLVVVGVAVFCVLKRMQRNVAWRIRYSELTFSDPPEILGQGTFGEVRCCSPVCSQRVPCLG